MKEENAFRFLAAGTHSGGTNLDFRMPQYIYNRKSDEGDPGEAPAGGSCRCCHWKPGCCQGHIVQEHWPGSRAGLLLPPATPVAGRFTSRTFTGRTQAAVWELRPRVVPDPGADGSLSQRCLMYVNLPATGLCATDSSLSYGDVVIPCDNKGAHCVGVVWSEVLHMRGTISWEHSWEATPHLCFYRGPEETGKEEQATNCSSKGCDQRGISE